MTEHEPEMLAADYLQVPVDRENAEVDAEAQVQSRMRALEAQLEASEARVRLQAKRLALLEERLRSLEKLASLGLMVSGVAHEINNLLTGASGFLHLLGRSPLGAEPKEHKMLSTVSSELTRCAALTRNLVHYSRHVKPPHEPLELSPLIEEVVVSLRQGFLEQGIEVQLEIEPGPAVISGVQSQIREVVKNLLYSAREAIRAKREPGWIRVVLAHEESCVILQVSDSGGKSREADRTFESFYSSREIPAGESLVMVVAKSIMKDHGGRMQLIKGDEGSIVMLRFPRTRNHPDLISRTR